MKTLLSELFPLKRGERFLAAICMGTPFFLLAIDSWGDTSMWQLGLVLVVVLVIPPVVADLTIPQEKKIAARGGHLGKVKQEKLAGWISAIVLLVMIAFAMFYLSWFGPFVIKNSISAYVGMNYPQIFGMLLSIASMLFITNGLIRHNLSKEHLPADSELKDKVPGERGFKAWLRRQNAEGARWYNVWIGFFLLMVVIFPCTVPEVKPVHMAAAFAFFASCFFGILLFHKPQHKWSSRCIALLMLVGFGIWLLNPILFHISFLDFVNLFWAEAFGLWVIGVHYILESFRVLT